jgi:hypothetical protein
LRLLPLYSKGPRSCCFRESPLLHLLCLILYLHTYKTYIYYVGFGALMHNNVGIWEIHRRRCYSTIVYTTIARDGLGIFNPSTTRRPLPPFLPPQLHSGFSDIMQCSALLCSPPAHRYLCPPLLQKLQLARKSLQWEGSGGRCKAGSWKGSWEGS